MQEQSLLAETKDPFTYSDPNLVRLKHIGLDIDISFEKRVLAVKAALTLEKPFSGNLVLDTRDLAIEQVECSTGGEDFETAAFELGSADEALGSALTIRLPAKTRLVRIRYTTSERASGLQWLESAQTEGKRRPFLFTQSEATHCRSWIPLQDTPQARTAYSARVGKPEGMKALMSASNNTAAFPQQTPFFTMPHPIPSYLIALAAGDLEFRALSERTGVFAEGAAIGRAAAELEDLERMLSAAEDLFGPYRWGRYDVLILPPSFPVGGMENPCLTFATPTIIAGDKSLTSLIAHEIAHSWSSNLVDNSTWADFWINEGFTVYMERRLIEKLYGSRRAEMDAALGLEDLERELAATPPAGQVLRPGIHDRDPNAVTSHVPYEKGALFLRTLEKAVGRKRFDAFLRRFFDDFAFQSIGTARLAEYIERNLLSDLAAPFPLNAWIYQPGIPASAARPKSGVLEEVERQARRWLSGDIGAQDLPAAEWSTQEWLRFLQAAASGLKAAKMAEIDRKYQLTGRGNAEIEVLWLQLAIRTNYRPAYARLEQFLETVGRRKYLKILYGELAKTPEGKELARAIYDRAKANYHPISRDAVRAILG